MFTFSYLADAGYMMFQVLTENKYDNDCTLQFRSALWLLYLLPIFDIFPCTTLLMFDTLRLCCFSAEHQRPVKHSQDSDSLQDNSYVQDSSKSTSVRRPTLLLTEEFGTYDGSENDPGPDRTPSSRKFSYENRKGSLTHFK